MQTKQLKQELNKPKYDLTSYQVELIIPLVVAAYDKGREDAYKEVKSFAFDLVKDCHPDCTPEEHQYHQGTWDSYVKLEKWAEEKV